ncbi:MAG TPA: GreA/GreB family elongation factor, partial [Paracoccaceae bacterium]|nr:GreA/GreB family elongation factor [Paracoccaceae bacterium]
MDDDTERTITLVGDDEQDAGAGLIGWSAPIARAVRGAAAGDVRRVRLPSGEKDWEVIAIAYPGDKLDLVAIPDFAFGAMENLGCVTFRETALLLDEGRATQA